MTFASVPPSFESTPTTITSFCAVLNLLFYLVYRIKPIYPPSFYILEYHCPLGFESAFQSFTTFDRIILLSIDNNEVDHCLYVSIRNFLSITHSEGGLNFFNLHILEIPLTLKWKQNGEIEIKFVLFITLMKHFLGVKILLEKYFAIHPPLPHPDVWHPRYLPLSSVL